MGAGIGDERKLDLPIDQEDIKLGPFVGRVSFNGAWNRDAEGRKDSLPQ